MSVTVLGDNLRRMGCTFSANRRGRRRRAPTHGQSLRRHEAINNMEVRTLPMIRKRQEMARMMIESGADELSVARELRVSRSYARVLMWDARRGFSPNRSCSEIKMEA